MMAVGFSPLEIPCLSSPGFSFFLSFFCFCTQAERVNVRYNSEETRDYTANLPPPPQPMDQGYGMGGYGGGQGPPPQHFDAYGGPPRHAPLQRPQYGSTAPQHFGGERRKAAPSPVLMVYHINKMTITCDKIFNLFCLYGNPIKVPNRAHALVWKRQRTHTRTHVHIHADAPHRCSHSHSLDGFTWHFR